MDEKVLEDIYQERLEEKIVEYFAEKNNLDYQTALNIYYNSELATKINAGKYGVQYLDFKVLTDILEKSELKRFKDRNKE
ncbi:MAG: hypothetical protein J6X80_09045 [Lachnospiraceae bacterium]|nr:hypothetical protein [Lachnospiraceae bacterium]